MRLFKTKIDIFSVKLYNKMIQEICDGVYSMSAGENMYLTIEKLGEDRNKWDFYRNETVSLVNGGDYFGSIGSLIVLISAVKKDKMEEFLQRYPDSHYWTHDLSLLDVMNRSVFNEDQIKTIPRASSGMNTVSQTHVVYASKSIVTGRLSFPASTRKGFARYVERYTDIIMTVGVRMGDTTCENRGIFRNPWNIIQGGYKNISMMLHSFVCEVSRQYYPLIKQLEIRPLEKMAKILFDVLPKDKFFIDGIIANSYDEGFTSEVKFTIPVTLLSLNI
jgi:hypothetical protein